MKLPESFQTSFRDWLGDEQAEAFFSSFDAPRTWGLRVNTLKLPVAAYLERTPFSLSAVAWSRDGFHHDGVSAPGRHPDYHAGLYYLQDPSAMLPAELLDVKPGERVLDACAAPGGKTVQLAAMLRNHGFLLSNDISPKRVKPLRRNLEGLGVSCAAVSNEDPGHLAAVFPDFFDAILLDVPCSGEGMFRKDETAVRSWKRHDAQELQHIQRSLLTAARAMLRPGGRMVYSTCTYNPDENEGNIAWALERYPDLSVVPAPSHEGGLASGRVDWVPGHPELAGAVRVWPHLAHGEGQFAVLLHKSADASFVPFVGVSIPENGGKGRVKPAGKHPQGREPGTQRPMLPAPAEALEAVKAFCDASLVPETTLLGSGRLLLHTFETPESYRLCGTALFWAGYADVCSPNQLHGLRLEMPGLYVGDWDAGRFEPSSAWLHALSSNAARNRIDLAASQEGTQRYLHGETLMVEGTRGWTAVLVDGFPLGWGKQEDGFLKNRYPKGWRML